MEFLVLLSIGLVFINVLLFNSLIKKHEELDKLIELANNFILAFDEVKKTVNGNNELYASWGREIREHSRIIANLFAIIQIHSYALKLAPPDDKLLEYSDEVVPPIA